MICGFHRKRFVHQFWRHLLNLIKPLDFPYYSNLEPPPNPLLCATLANYNAMQRTEGLVLESLVLHGHTEWVETRC